MPVVYLATHIPALRCYRVHTLIGASILFYALSGIDHAAVLCAEIIWVWVLAVPRNLYRLILSILGPAFALIYFKYSGFLFSPLLHKIEAKSGIVIPFLNDVALPAGISFFTFQIIGYAVDRYRGADRPNLSNFALFVSFFPQLVAGPIVRLHEVAAQIERIPTYRLTLANWNKALVFCTVGLVIKVILADSLAAVIQNLGTVPAEFSITSAWYGVFAYSFQIYFDFFGYSLIAIGLALLFGVVLPNNFDRPYNSLNPRDFWRRWHISLSYWIRDYLYLALGGNRRYTLNIIIIFAICGLWHGAAWTFVAWGFFHAVLVAGYSFVQPAWDWLPRFLQWALTFVLVSVGWIFFQYDFAASADYFQALVGSDGTITPLDWRDAALLAISSIAVFLIQPQSIYELVTRGGFVSISTQTALAVILALCMFAIQDSDTFIYFRF
jgi:alginate O-acetyltransferase complex protein AlgI